MDDDDVLEPGTFGADDAAASAAAAKSSPTTPNTATAPATGSSDVPPPKPPRPLTEAQKNQQMLKEAFPSVDDAVIKAVLTASGGRIEAAFNALLEMTDPEAAERDRPPPPPPRPVADPVGPTSTDPLQLEADERYARQLAEHYESVGAYEARTANRDYRGGGRVPRGRQQTGLSPADDGEREHSFIDDDLPVIKESLRKGFMETQAKVNTWFTNLKKKIDEQFDDEDERPDQGRSSFMGRPTRNQARRSADYDRYDADPELLSDDFAGMKFHSDGTPIQNQRPGGSNPNFFRPPPPSKSPKPSDGRKVSFRDTVEDIDAYNASPKIPPKDAGAPGPGGAAKTSKWQPLSAVEPSPIAENDPFSLGDSDDEREVKDRTAGSREIRMEDTERLRQATADAMADSLVDVDKSKPATGSGTGNAAK
ncbi:uncharacterized protein THITE_2123662 [Thermothielavioides terrestris NRRL 8126]|uniref:CUE domain-containing protein n=2 Tax=Thermothielavioides terrestris TaxID=2587410 RepID=G2RHR7_THETT|nr:uncharacterized protein THITE_2123662 [Thermothielavioides terrestris NRRL 8126]AEO71379.1 hypothetical protein THITE_2123662 [Thermothielavioides terrestris NRRL 8126]